MKIDDNSYYIKYKLQEGTEYAHMSHYGEVWEDGFTVEEYSISNNAIDYEDAVWHGFSGHIDNCWKRILARDFNRWRDEINTSKQNIIDMGSKAGVDIVKELKVGDCVFITIPPYDLEDECRESEYCFLEVDFVGNDLVRGKQMFIGTYLFAYCCDDGSQVANDNYWIDYALRNNNVTRIDKSVFYHAVEKFRWLTTKLISEIKKKA